jgi:LacI family transcriptional regulator
MAHARLSDVAKLAGVSAGSVSNYLNRPERVNPETARRVSGAIARLGYVPNTTARQLRRGQSDAIGFVITDISNPFFTTLATGAAQAARESGYALLLATSADDEVGESQYLDIFENRNLDGVLVTPARHTPNLDALRAHGTRVVLVDRESEDYCSVAVDDVAGGVAATKHLIEVGKRRLMFVGGERRIPQMRDRVQGARAAVLAAGGGVTLVEEHRETLSIDLGRTIASEILALPATERPDGIVAANDLVALGMMQVLHGAMSIPGDIAIVGYDDIDFAAASLIPLTSMRQPTRELGYRGAAMLIAELAEGDSHEHRHEVFQPELVVRASTAPAA